MLAIGNYWEHATSDDEPTDSSVSLRFPASFLGMGTMSCVYWCVVSNGNCFEEDEVDL